MLRLHDPVIYVDTHGVARGALLTTIWAKKDDSSYDTITDEKGNVVETNEPSPTVNLVYVSGDATRTDNAGYGRQIERGSSVVHMANQTVFGNYWRRLTEHGKDTEQPATT